MKRYFSVYRMLLRMNFSMLVGYRENFYNSLLASLAWGSFSLYSIVLLTSKSSMIFGWKREEMLLLNGVYGIIISLFHMQFSKNFERFSEIIHMGQLDSILVKPMDSQFLVSFWLFGYASISRTIIATGYTVYVASMMHIPFSLSRIAGFMTLAVLGLVTLYSIWFIIITFTVWFTRLHNLTELMFTITGAARYPQEIMRQMNQYIFLFLFPITLIITLPTKAYLNRLGSGEFVAIGILSGVLFVSSRAFWRFALRSYTSASS